MPMWKLYNLSYGGTTGPCHTLVEFSFCTLLYEQFQLQIIFICDSYSSIYYLVIQGHEWSLVNLFT